MYVSTQPLPYEQDVAQGQFLGFKLKTQIPFFYDNRYTKHSSSIFLYLD